MFRPIWPVLGAVLGAVLLLLAACSAASPEPNSIASSAPGPASPEHTMTPRPTPSASLAPTPKPTVGTDVGQRAPAFSLTTTEGSSLSLPDLRGRPVWVVFWAPGCPSCVIEMGMMEMMYRERSGSGLEIVGIAVSTSSADAAAFGEAVGITYPLAVDASAGSDASAVDYGVFVLPTHFFIDRDGIVRGWVSGDAPPDLLEERLAAIIGPAQ